MAQRVLIFAHAATPGTRSMTFGDQGLPLDFLTPWTGRIDQWMSGPEPACLATADCLAGEGGRDNVAVEGGFRGCDFGTWDGSSAAEVQQSDPRGLTAWLRDADAVPHEGESLAHLILRVGRVLDSHAWPQGLSGLVVPPLVLRALIVSVLGAPPEAIFSLDAPPLATAKLSRSAKSWRLQLG